MANLSLPVLVLIAVIGLAIALLLAWRLSKDPSFGVILIGFFLPFERIPSLDLGGFTFKINHIVGIFTFVFWLLAVIYNRRKVAPNPLTIPLLLLFFCFLLSGLGAGNQFRAVTVYVSMLLMVVIYLAALNGLTSKRVVSLVVGAIFVSATLMALIGIYQFFGDLAGLPTSLTGLDPGYTKAVFGFPRIHAFSKEPLYYANYLFIPLGLSLALFFSGKARKSKVETIKPTDSLWSKMVSRIEGPWLLPLILLLFVNFLLTLSRGAYIALVPFALVFVIFYARKIFTLRNIILGLLTLTISVTAAYKIIDSVSPDAIDNFLAHAELQDLFVTKTGESAFGRLEAFSQAIAAWQSSPLLGIGPGNFGPYVAYYPILTPPTGWLIVNNEYLELLAETGILGTACFGLILVMVFIRSIIAYRKTNDDYLKAILVGLMAAFAGIFTQYNFFSTLYIIQIWVLFAFLIGVQNIVLRPKALSSTS